MAATPRSPPETPFKEASTANTKENVAPRTPLPDRPLNGNDKSADGPEEVQKPIDPREEVQVPSSIPPKVTLIEQPKKVITNDEVEESNETKEIPNDSELPEFDWEDLTTRFTKEIQAVNKSEDDIVLEFEKFSDVCPFK